MRSATVLSGYRFTKGWARLQKVFFAVGFSRPIVFWLGSKESSVVQANPREVRGTDVRAFFEFTNQSLAPITVKVALSSVSEEGALAALEAVRGKSFDTIREETQNAWWRELAKIKVSRASHDDRVMFATALYHSFLPPVRFSDARGEYQESQINVNFANPATKHLPVKRVNTGATHYDLFSLWDTFRAVHPLFTLVQQERVPD